MDPYVIASFIWATSLVFTFTACYWIWTIYKRLYIMSPEYKWILYSAILITSTIGLILLYHIGIIKGTIVLQNLTIFLALAFYFITLAMLVKLSSEIKELKVSKLSRD